MTQSPSTSTTPLRASSTPPASTHGSSRASILGSSASAPAVRWPPRSVSSGIAAACASAGATSSLSFLPPGAAARPPSREPFGSVWGRTLASRRLSRDFTASAPPDLEGLMPTSAPRPCPGPGCRALVSGGGRCPACRRRYEEKRGTSTDRGYDGKWRGLRVAYLRQHQVCSIPGCGKPSTDVDHVQSIRLRPDLRLEWSNLRAYCHGHHSAKTARHDGSFGNARSR
jgi:hypothetical protein